MKEKVEKDSRVAANGKKKRPPVTIRQMEIDDLPEVFHLGEELFTADRVPNLYRTWDPYEVVSFYLSDSDYCFVAETTDQIVGFALGTTISKPRSAWKYAHLVWLGVRDDLRRSHVAERLLEHFKDTVVEEGARILFVDSEADNETALAFFKKMGFGNPKEHIYLSLNLKQKRKKPRSDVNLSKKRPVAPPATFPPG